MVSQVMIGIVEEARPLEPGNQIQCTACQVTGNHLCEGLQGWQWWFWGDRLPIGDFGGFFGKKGRVLVWPIDHPSKLRAKGGLGISHVYREN